MGLDRRGKEPSVLVSHAIETKGGQEGILGVLSPQKHVDLGPVAVLIHGHQPRRQGAPNGSDLILRGSDLRLHLRQLIFCLPGPELQHVDLLLGFSDLVRELGEFGKGQLFLFLGHGNLPFVELQALLDVGQALFFRPEALFEVFGAGRIVSFEVGAGGPPGLAPQSPYGKGPQEKGPHDHDPSANHPY